MFALIIKLHDMILLFFEVVMMLADSAVATSVSEHFGLLD